VNESEAIEVMHTIRCRAVQIALVLETIDADGQVLGEAVTPPQTLFPKFWPELSAQVAAAVARLNAPPEASA